MDNRLTRLLDRSKEKEPLQRLSVKMGFPLCLLHTDGVPAAYGTGREPVEADDVEVMCQPLPAAGSCVPVMFMGEVVGFLTTMIQGEYVGAALAAAADNLETSFEFEAEIEDMSSEIVHLYDELSTFFSLSSKLGSEIDLDEICRRAVEECSIALNADTVILLLLDPASGMLVNQSCMGRCIEQSENISISASSGVAGELFARRSSSVICDPAADSGLPLVYPCRSVLCTPLVTDNRNIGMLLVSDKGVGEEFRSQEIKLMDAISSEIAAAIKKAQLYEQINRLFIHTIEALASAIDAKDPYTYGHSRRVADYTAIICREMNMARKESKAIELASILHDIGKIGTPEYILQKPYGLLPEEIVKIKEHPVLGAQILGAIEELQDVIDGIRHHHERFDGKGYPDQMASGQIPIQARIIAVADCFDAMTSNRPYRKSIDPEKALIIMEDCSGSQFYPRVLAAFKAASTTEVFKAICVSVPEFE